MKTNRRILRLVEYFERSPVVNLEHLQAELNLNENVIRYEIENLNDYLELLNLPLIYKKDGNYISDIRDYDALIKSLSSIYKMSPDERKNVLFYELAYRNKLNITHMMNLLDVSRNTVKSDLTFLKEELESESIHMEGYKICLNQEREIRTFIFNRWKNQFNLLRVKKLKKGADEILFQRKNKDDREKKREKKE